MDDYHSADYDNVGQIEDITGGVRYMPIKRDSVVKPDYQSLQQHNNSGKTLKHLQQNQKRIITVLVVLGVLLLLVIVAGSALVSVSWRKLNSKGDPNFFQNCKQENTSCTFSTWLTACTTEGVLVHTQVSHTYLHD